MAVIQHVKRAVGRDLATTVGEEAARRLSLADPCGDVPVTPDEPITEADVAELPETVQRYLGYMGVVGRPRDWSFKARFVGRFRLGRRWMPCEAWQYNTCDPVTRIFDMRLDLGAVIPMIGRDSYVYGRGSMHGELLGLFTVANGAGHEFDVGELVTYLNDALMLAPGMLLGGSTTWTEVDGHCFDVTLDDAGHTVSARVLVDDLGALRDFSTLDRYCDLPDGLVRTRWTTPVDAWTTTESGRRLPSRTRAIWHLPDGPLTYVEGRFADGSIAYNVGPGGANPTP